MKTLMILRHAKSSWKESGIPDHDRPLNKRGKRDAPLVGQLIREQDLVPDLVISSTAVRARSTAQTVVEECGYTGAVHHEPLLYEGDLEDYIDLLRSLDDEPARVMLVGHNPGLEEFLEMLTGEYQRLPTAALACVSLPIDSWSEMSEEIQGTLTGLWQAKKL